MSVRARIGLLALIMLVASACSPQTSTVTPAAAPTQASGVSTVQVTLTNSACTASTQQTTAGPVTFQVQNTTGDAVTEVELLNGDLIVGEKENLTPGLSGSFSVTLPAGDYQLYCPGAATEKSAFTVQPAKAGQASAAVDPQVAADLQTAASGYRTYVQQEVAQLVTTTQTLVDAVNAGDLSRARDLYPQARTHYESIEPVAERFGDLDPAIDMREDDAPDPTDFTGFHRLEKAMWQDNSLADMQPVAATLLQDVQKLQQLVNDPAQFSFDAADIANGSTELLDEVAKTKITGEEERYSHLDLLDVSANVDASRKGFQLLQPGLQRLDPQLASTIAARFNDLDGVLAPYKTTTGWRSYDQLTPADVKALSQAVDNLAEPLSQVAGRVVVASREAAAETPGARP
jgi:iron uptake system component EfeO